MRIIKVAIVGGSGYTGQELLRLLARHSAVEVMTVCSRSESGTRIDARFPMFRGLYDLVFSDMDVARLKQADLVFFATPNGVAMLHAPELLDAGVRVIDLSADFRINDAHIWKLWYGRDHICPQLIDQAVYGLPELDFAKSIKTTSLIANPGCYATAIQLSIAPLMQLNGAIIGNRYVVDGKSGVSGAGKSPLESSLMAQAGENFSAYKVTGHRHHAESIQQLHKIAQYDQPSLVFVPHLAPMVRGILTTTYIYCRDTSFDFYKHYKDFYAGKDFIDVVPDGLPMETKNVAGTNLCRICVQLQGDSLVVVAVIDNLIKGAAGQAIQNMNIMFSLEHTAGLELIPHYP